MKNKEKRYDAPMEGYKRHTIFVNIELFEEFKEEVENSGKSIKNTIEEMIKEWMRKKGKK